MAKVGWSAGIDFVSGALSKPSKSGQHSCNKMTADQAAFIDQKDTPGGKKTMKSYLLSLELAAYDQAHQG